MTKLMMSSLLTKSERRVKALLLSKSEGIDDIASYHFAISFTA
jgi:hypothetical protein